MENFLEWKTCGLTSNLSFEEGFLLLVWIVFFFGCDFAAIFFCDFAVNFHLCAVFNDVMNGRWRQGESI